MAIAELSEQRLPLVGITIGDAAGIGPEISLKAVADDEVLQLCTPVLIGDLNFLKKTSAELKLDLELVPMSDDIGNKSESIRVFDTSSLPENIRIGHDDAVTGKAAAECIQAAVQLCINGRIDAISTAPISKKAIALGGFDYPGHTEFLAHLTNTRDFAMSFFAEQLRVVLVSTHVSLRRAIDLVTTAKLIEVIRFTDVQLARLLHRHVKIAVAGLNPHASEHGMFGGEEMHEITPAIRTCREEYGINVSGPYSPDTIFLRGHAGEFDAVVACYHDQATIAVKSLSFGSAVNVTLGLPIIRTSVDHGTAYDIAGQGIADASSMKAAIRLAAELAAVKKTKTRP
jgi:4-phospho-D-threonate 3-dehydrogenase / 4-phospho-D-erythronate 3-dehydrogenase